MDSGGAGKYRGGLGMEIALVPHDAPDDGIHYVISGKGADFPMSEGLAGGYPGAPNSYIWVHNNESSDAAKKEDTRYAQQIDDMAGNQERISWGVYPMMGEDSLYLRWNGGGGFGDPLERDPDALLSDCRERIVSPEVANDVYGVVFVKNLKSVDEAATATRRAELRRARTTLGTAE